MAALVSALVAAVPAAVADETPPRDDGAAGVAPAPRLETISLGYATGKPTGDLPFGLSSISDDGRLVVFPASVEGLVPAARACTPPRWCVYARDRATGETSVVSSLSDGTPVGDRGLVRPQVSGDGRIMAFTSDARRYTPDAEGHPRTYLRVKNLLTGRVQSLPAPSGGPAQEPPLLDAWAISRHGRYVVITGAYPSATSVRVTYRYDRRDGTWTPVGNPATSTRPLAMTGSGRYVFGFDPTATGEARDYRMYEPSTGRSWPIPRPPGSADARQWSSAFSGDGRLLFVTWEDYDWTTGASTSYRVAYRTRDGAVTEVIDHPDIYSIYAADHTGRYLAVDTRNGSLGTRYSQTARYDRLTGELTLVSRSRSGRPGNYWSAATDITPDGQTILFHSAASNLAPEGDRGPVDPTNPDPDNDLFVAELTQPTTRQPAP